jgi:tRNA pseudouridine(55) synthase
MFIVEKPLGWTPNQLINTIKTKHPEYENLKMSYAGRLDPMARGLMFILMGDECKTQDLMITKRKKYRFQLLLGIDSDTNDILGLPKTNGVKKMPSNEDIAEVIDTIIGKMYQKYPNYSSIYVTSKMGERKPLWKWTKEDRLSEIEIPGKYIEVYQLSVLRKYNINSNDLYNIIINKLSKNTEGDFRKVHIIEEWRKLLSSSKYDTRHMWKIVEIDADVSSGTYIRSLCKIIGQKLNCGGLAFDINRTSIDNIDTPNFYVTI